MTADVVDKIQILHKQHELHNGDYETLEGMVKYEMDNKLTTTTGSDGLRSGSRTLLRLNRALGESDFCCTPTSRLSRHIALPPPLTSFPNEQSSSSRSLTG